MSLLLLCLALLLSARPDGAYPLPPPGTRSGIAVDSWMRHTSDGRPDLLRTARDILHNNLLRGATAGMGFALLLLALGRRKGWGKSPWMAEDLPGAAIHNGTKAIHLGVYTGLCALAVAAANAMGGDLERDESRLPEAFLLVGESLAALGAVGMLARRLDRKRPNPVTSPVRKWFDWAVDSPERPVVLGAPRAPSVNWPSDFEAQPLVALASELWARLEGDPDFPGADSPALTAGLRALFSLRREIRAGGRKAYAALKAEVVLVRQDGPYRTATVRVEAALDPSGTEQTSYWTFARVHPSEESSAEGWVLSAMASEDEWAPPDSLRLERLRPWLEGTGLERPSSSWGGYAMEEAPRPPERLRSLLELEDAALRLFVGRIRGDLRSGQAYPAVASVDAMTATVSEDEWVAQVAIVWELRDGQTDGVVAGSERRELLKLVMPAGGRDWSLEAV